MPFGIHAMVGPEADDDVAGLDLDNPFGVCEYNVTVLTKDGLGAMQCIVAAEQRDLLTARLHDERYKLSLLWDQTCWHHTACLCTKPIVLNLGVNVKLMTSYVRLAHVLSSGRALDSYRKAVVSVAKTTFRFHLVPVLPPECDGWMRRSRLLLFSTPMARLLPDDTINRVVAFDNGDWSSEYLDHYCLGPGRCVCPGDERGATSMVGEIALEVSGSDFGDPLFYRFKAVGRPPPLY